ncbi:TNKS2 [Cordylochernes scorpioides]|uniref:TNKS2 n=1 Tax=Cordylochernes scorpioides TaxID=51811 RepID=A0ABY6KCY3_9ARAC|nr:TNKS2 [Cordylochernes scorpioides]
MAARRVALPSSGDILHKSTEYGKELFEACRNGDVNRVKKLINSQNVNVRDASGRKSTHSISLQRNKLAQLLSMQILIRVKIVQIIVWQWIWVMLRI